MAWRPCSWLGVFLKFLWRRGRISCRTWCTLKWTIEAVLYVDGENKYAFETNKGTLDWHSTSVTAWHTCKRVPTLPKWGQSARDDIVQFHSRPSELWKQTHKPFRAAILKSWSCKHAHKQKKKKLLLIRQHRETIESSWISLHFQ